MQKFLLIGLGNSRKKYQATRHNSGHMFADYLAKNPIAGLEVQKTNCFMNSSGEWIYNAYKNYNNCKDYSRLLVAHDDLDLPLGKFKIQFGRGPHDHKGLLSIYQSLGTKKFWHVRVGVDNRAYSHPEERTVRDEGSSYVLKPFKREEKEILKKTFAEITRQLTHVLL